MKNSEDSIKYQIVNRGKLIYVPLLISLLAVAVVSTSSYYISRMLLLDQLRQEGLKITDRVLNQIKSNSSSLETINELLEEKIRMAGKTVLMNEDRLSDGLLHQLKVEMNVDELHWMDPDGKILYSTIEAYLNWVPFEGHPLYEFIRSDSLELMEDIRPDAEFNIPIKYGAVKNQDGYFVQVGVLAEKVDPLTRSFTYDSLVQELTAAETIPYVMIVDESMSILAAPEGAQEMLKRRIESQGLEDKLQTVFQGNQFLETNYDMGLNEEVLDIWVPIKEGDQVLHVLGIGFSMRHANEAIFFISIAFGIIACLLYLLIMWVQRRNIINPVNQINRQIQKVDVEKDIGYRLDLPERHSFYGLARSINLILDKTFDYFSRMERNQEELTAAYEELTASEEELRAQYEDIQAYTGEIEHIARHDALTDLYNRRWFVDKLESELSAGRPGAVLLMDLDNFKEINDMQGHLYGDEVIKAISRQLKALEQQGMFLSRFGGDEFLVLFANESRQEKIEAFARQILDRFRNKIFVGEDELYLSCSMGISLYPQDSSSVSQLLMNADLAMYKVKASGKNNYLFFDESMTAHLKEQVEIERILREAIKEDGFRLVYQPQVCTFTGQVTEVEALIRLKRHAVSPNQFIPIAEETGMIVEIGRWVTKEAIRQAARWSEKGYPTLPIAINFSVKQLNDLSYIEFLNSTLAEYGVKPAQLHMEITEGIFLDKREEAIHFLTRLKRMGIKIALDDFGTGYSSLNYLTYLPVHKIKLDKSLSDKFLELDNVKAMENLIALVHSLDMEIVAEGVETIEQYQRLKQGGCNRIQGYLFSRPLEPDQLETLLSYNFLNKLGPDESD